jgi:hypothetical protein
VRNDYPLLACLELGASWVRTPVADLADPTQARRLSILRAEGIRVQAIGLGESEALACIDDLADPAPVDRLELQLPGRTAPEPAALSSLLALDLPLVVTPVLPGQPVPGKQHHRTRVGYLVEELDGLDPRAVHVGCRIDPSSPWEMAAQLRQAVVDRSWRLQLLAELPGLDDVANANAVARSLVAAASVDAPVFFEPLIDMDRTMDVVSGLLDGRCNPRPAFDVARTLRALLRDAGGAALDVGRHGPCEVVGIGEHGRLLIADTGSARLGEIVVDAAAGPLRVCRLAAGTVTAFDPDGRLDRGDGPLFVYPATDGGGRTVRG